MNRLLFLGCLILFGCEPKIGDCFIWNTYAYSDRYIQLTKVGKYSYGFCSFHEEKTPPICSGFFMVTKDEFKYRTAPTDCPDTFRSE